MLRRYGKKIQKEDTETKCRKKIQKNAASPVEDAAS